MSAWLDNLLGSARRAECARSDPLQVALSVARNAPDVLVIDLKESVLLEPQNQLAVDWVVKHVPNVIAIAFTPVFIERRIWPGLCRAALNEGIRLA